MSGLIESKALKIANGRRKDVAMWTPQPHPRTAQLLNNFECI